MLCAHSIIVFYLRQLFVQTTRSTFIYICLTSLLANTASLKNVSFESAAVRGTPLTTIYGPAVA